MTQILTSTRESKVNVEIGLEGGSTVPNLGSIACGIKLQHLRRQQGHLAGQNLSNAKRRMTSMENAVIIPSFKTGVPKLFPETWMRMNYNLCFIYLLLF